MVYVMNTDEIRTNWVGRVINGRFTLLQWLGGSESSAVFLTEIEGNRPQKAAIKLIPADASDAEARIARWAAITPLSHPHLVRLLDSGHCEIDNTRLVYAVMEYAEENLAEILPVRPLTPTETREMLDPVIDALSYLHGKGFVHGRLKPSNIMVVSDQLKLSCDNLHPAGEVRNLPQSTRVYDAPEAVSGTISPAADIWSLGITLIEALTQRPPVWNRSAQSEPTVPESIPQPFAGVARESLRSDPERRCTLSDVKARLGGDQSLSDSDGETSKMPPTKLRGLALAALVLVLLAVFAVHQLRSRQTQSSSPAEVQQSEPATAAPPPQSPTPPKRSPKHAAANDAVVKDAVVKQVMPDVLPRATATIRGQVNVTIRVTVDADGNVSNADYDSPGPSKYFAKAALEAARRWKFKPVQVSGSDVSRVWVLRFQFRQTGTEVTPVEVSR
jgi:serine/threonine-protein kinase